MTQTVTVLGPNGISDATFHVHRAGCRDIARYRGLDRRDWHIDASSEREVVEDCFSDFIPENDNGEPTTWEDYRGEIRFFPCVTF